MNFRIFGHFWCESVPSSNEFLAATSKDGKNYPNHLTALDGWILQWTTMIFGLAYVELQIDLIPEDPFIVLDIMDETTKDDEASSTMRLAKYLVERRDHLVTSKRVVIIGSIWISFLVARFGATSIVAWDEEQNETRLRILQHTNQFINRPTTCPVQTPTNGEDLDDTQLIIITSLADDFFFKFF
jgi:hypothetical protein